MPQISTKDSGILELIKNSKTNNNIVGYHVVSRRVISSSSQMFSVCIDTQKWHIIVIIAT